MMPKSLPAKELKPTYVDTVTGYAITAMRLAEVPPDVIQQVVIEMRIAIDKYSLAEAAQISAASPY